MSKDEIKGIVRIMSTDIEGKIPVGRALIKIKGIGPSISNVICKITKTDPKKPLGLLDKNQIDDINKAIDNPAAYYDKLPSYLLNRRKDNETGKDIHISGAKIDLKKMEDINLLKRLRTYRGIRHERHLPVRGQRTRSSFRGKTSLGVIKSKAKK